MNPTVTQEEDANNLANNQDDIQNMDYQSMAMDKNAYQTFTNEMQEFMDRIVGDKNLDKLSSDFNKIYKMLRGSYQTERRYILKCKELSEKINQATLNFQTVMNASQAQAETMNEYNNRVTEAWKEVQRLQQEESKKKEQEKNFKLQIAQLQRLLDQPIHGTIDEMEKIKGLKNDIQELNLEQENQREKLMLTRKREEALEGKLNQIDSELLQLKEEKSKYELLVLHSREEAKKKDQIKNDLIRQTNELRERIEVNKGEKQGKENDMRRLDQEIQFNQNEITKNQNEIGVKKNFLRQLEIDYGNKVKELNSRINNKNMVVGQTGELERTKEHQENQLHDLRKTLKKLNHEADILKDKLTDLQSEKQKNDWKRNLLKQQIRDLNDNYDRQKKLVEEERKDIEEKIHQRDVLNKKVVKTEEQNLKDHGRLNTYQNQLKKLKNKIQGFKNQADKLHKKIYQLELEKDKYSAEASSANARFFQCIQEVKIKSNAITKLQKKNVQMEAKLKQQQNLYEAVRSDRNLYSKNLIEAQEEIQELNKKFKRMTHQISQLKEEIRAKDQALQKEHFDYDRIKKENSKLIGQIERLKLSIKNYDEMIKTQENDIGRLKYVISQAQGEKQKQKKDYEMVINERDILGTQLIKRNQELALLYEKIKIQQSTLAKGQSYFKQRMDDIMKLKNKIASTKFELSQVEEEVSHQILNYLVDQVACLPSLKSQVLKLDKQLLEEKQKVKALTEELSKPVRVHRWRKLESTQPQTYQHILKIQSLQKRLIAKTEEVAEKDVLIQEKEKLYVELKNILAKQAGPEVAEKLGHYQKNLRERSKQLKQMMDSIVEYQAQVNSYNFEIQRLKNKQNELNEAYYQRRRQEIQGVVPQTIVEEAGIGQDEDQQQQQQQQQQQEEMEAEFPPQQPNQ